jgi:transcriptional regulator with XRE-family HTH domain
MVKRAHWRKDRLADAMKMRGIKKNADLARFLKLNPQTTHKWLRGDTAKISAVDAFYVADRLDVGVRWLLGLTDNPVRREVLDPEEQRVLELYDRLRKADKEWAADWISDGHRLLRKIEPAAPPPARVLKTPHKE